MAKPRGRPPGPGNKPWADALRIASSDTIEGKKRLRKLAEKTWELALNGDMQAIKEIGDRLDGKPAQALEHSGSVAITHEAALAELE